MPSRDGHRASLWEAEDHPRTRVADASALRRAARDGRPGRGRRARPHSDQSRVLRAESVALVSNAELRGVFHSARIRREGDADERVSVPGEVLRPRAGRTERRARGVDSHAELWVDRGVRVRRTHLHSQDRVPRHHPPSRRRGCGRVEAAAAAAGARGEIRRAAVAIRGDARREGRRRMGASHPVRRRGRA